jgi:hypothetical protein
MPAVTNDKALELLTKAVQDQLETSELLEVYNELFPATPYTSAAAQVDAEPLRTRLVDYFNNGLAIDEVTDLWRLIFPEHRNIWYDEEAERLHYSEKAEAAATE